LAEVRSDWALEEFVSRRITDCVEDVCPHKSESGIHDMTLERPEACPEQPESKRAWRVGAISPEPGRECVITTFVDRQCGGDHHAAPDSM